MTAMRRGAGVAELGHGVAIGIVKDLNDPKGEGRVVLEYPWLPQSLRSDWAPIATPLAGPQRGMFYMPEINDEVLVAFEQGDFTHPFVVGFLWSGGQKPPETNPQRRLIKTPGGHQFIFADDSPKKITLQSAGGLQIVLDDAGSGSITLHGGGRILAMQDGKVQIS